jgi:hypothetical protein
MWKNIASMNFELIAQFSKHVTKDEKNLYEFVQNKK